MKILHRECFNFPQRTLNGYDDFCVAAPYSQIRGSYRACMCTTNACNLNYSECVQRTNPYWDQRPPIYSPSIVPLTQRVKCYRPYEDYRPQPYSSITPLCASNDDECKNYLFDHGVLCAIDVDRTNQVTRQTLPPSLYGPHISSNIKQSSAVHSRGHQKVSTLHNVKRMIRYAFARWMVATKIWKHVETSKATYIDYSAFFSFLLLILNICF